MHLPVRERLPPPRSFDPEAFVPVQTTALRIRLEVVPSRLRMLIRTVRLLLLAVALRRVQLDHHHYQ